MTEQGPQGAHSDQPPISVGGKEMGGGGGTLRILSFHMCTREANSVLLSLVPISGLLALLIWIMTVAFILILPKSSQSKFLPFPSKSLNIHLFIYDV